MTDNVAAIVIGGHFQGLGIIRSLARKGVDVTLIDHEPCMARFSKYITQFYRCPDILDEEDFVEFLHTLGQKEKLRGAVVFPTDDETVSVLARKRKFLGDCLRLTTPDWDIVKYAYNKILSYRLAEKINVPFPKTYYPENRDDLVQLNLPFPVIIKPAVMRNFFRATGKKVFRAANQDELIAAYQKACTVIDPEEIIIQEEIPDVAQHLYSFCPLFKEGETLARIIAKRARQHPMDFGQASTYAYPVDLPELEELGTRILKAMNYYGLCEVEFIQDSRDGAYKFLEVNPRIWGWHTLAIRAGVNLPYLLYNDMTGHVNNHVSYRKDVKWIRMTTDLPTSFSEILKGRLKPGDYIQSLKGEKEFAVFAWDDMFPFIVELLMLPYLWMKRGF